MSDPRYPALYQVNARVWLTELSRALGRRATLDDIPEAELDRMAERGFDRVWFPSTAAGKSWCRMILQRIAAWRVRK